MVSRRIALLLWEDEVFFVLFWQHVRNWLGVYYADPSTNVDHFLRFRTCSGHVKSRCSFMSLIWFASSCVIWKERNYRIFKGKEKSPYQLLESIKLISFWWFKAKFAVFYYKFNDWCNTLFYACVSANCCFCCWTLWCNISVIFSGTPCAREIIWWV